MLRSLGSVLLPFAIPCAICFASVPGCRSSGGDSLVLESEEGASAEVLKARVEHRGLIVNQISLDDSARSGWAVTADRRVFRLSGGRWLVDSQLDTLAPHGLSIVQVSVDGETAWAFDGIRALKHTGSRWEVVDSLRVYDPGSVWVSPDGSRGSAVTSSATYQLSRGRWMPAGGGPISIDLLVMDNDATDGWAKGMSGSLFRYLKGSWVPHQDSVGLTTMMTTRDGVFFGIDEQNRIWRVVDERWEQVDDTHFRAAGEVKALWPDARGRSGWIVGSEGVFRWEENQPLVRGAPKDRRRARGIWMNTDGSRGYVFGEDGIQYHFEEGRWYADNPLRTFVDEIGTTSFRSIAMSPNGRTGWALGEEGIAARYEGGKWQRDSIPSRVRGVRLWQLALNESATAGWAVGDSGAVITLSDGQWLVAHEPWQGFGDALCAAPGPDLKTLFATGDTALWMFKGGAWKAVREPAPLDTAGVHCAWADRRAGGLLVWHDDGTLVQYRLDGSRLIPSTKPDSNSRYSSVLPDADGSAAWVQAASSNGQIVPPLTRWGGHSRDSIRSPFSMYPLAVGDGWIDSRGRRGIAITMGASAVFHRINGEWIEDRLPPAISGNRVSLWVHPSGSHGWIVGELGTILRLESDSMPQVKLHIPRGSSLETLSGEFVLTRAGKDSLLLKGIDVTGCSDPGLMLTDGSHYTVKRTSPSSLRVRFAQGVRDQVLSRYSKSRCMLRFEIALSGVLTEPVPVALVQPFHVRGRPRWQYALAGLIILLLVNLVLVLAATRYGLLRRVIFSPIGANVAGLVVGKYLLIEPLVRYIRPIRLAMFRDYRHGLRSSATVERWRNRKYIPPGVTLDRDAPSKPGRGEPWAAVFEQICTAPYKRIWIVAGPSGLGKTALLERWVGLALESGRTPLLLRFGPGGTAVGEATVVLAQHGDLRLDEGAVLSLLEAGGFVLLLDGLNEDRQPQATREFVRRTSSRNTVVVTSQFDPGWGVDLHMEAVHLSPFGREQLLLLLQTEWVDRLLDADHLQDAVGLPQTAELIARFIQHAKRLPVASIEVYHALRQLLPPGREQLNLEASAWELFCQNTRLLPKGEKLSESFLADATKAGVLTATIVQQERRYSFVHDRVHRYFVACFLASQPPKSLTAWHEELQTLLPRVYWREVLEIWSEISALSVHAGQTAASRYEAFLREIGAFDLVIFRAVYRQADRFAAAGLVTLGTDFITDAARILSGDPSPPSEAN